MTCSLASLCTVTFAGLFKVLLCKRSLRTPESRSYAVIQQEYGGCVISNNDILCSMDKSVVIYGKMRYTVQGEYKEMRDKYGKTNENKR